MALGVTERVEQEVREVATEHLLEPGTWRHWPGKRFPLRLGGLGS